MSFIKKAKISSIELWKLSSPEGEDLDYYMGTEKEADKQAKKDYPLASQMGFKLTRIENGNYDLSSFILP